MLAGCKTTMTEKTDYDISLTTEKNTSSVLDHELKKLDEDIEKYPNRHDLHYQKGAVYYQQEDYHSSARCLENAIALAPEESKYHYNLGRVYMKTGEEDLAEAQFRLTVERMPPDRYSGPHAALGLLLARRNDFQGAIAEFKKCIDIEPGNAMYYFFLGSLNDILGNREETILYYREYLERGGQAFRKKVAYILERLGVKVEEVDVMSATETEDSELEMMPEPLRERDRSSLAPIERPRRN
jgi:tetratricopeptide (TPR) repeat protein